VPCVLAALDKSHLGDIFAEREALRSRILDRRKNWATYLNNDEGSKFYTFGLHLSFSLSRCLFPVAKNNLVDHSRPSQMVVMTRTRKGRYTTRPPSPPAMAMSQWCSPTCPGSYGPSATTIRCTDTSRGAWSVRGFRRMLRRWKH
jgi:hypothetical protein